jgi:zinc-ribbon domain
MFCTHCGTQVEEGKNFCRSCGARIGRASEAVPVKPPPTEPAATPAKEQSPVVAAEPATVPDARERRGLGAAAIVGGCVAFILAAGAGIYFGTDLLRPSAKPEPPETVAQAPAPAAAPAADAPTDALWEEAKNSAGDAGSASAPQPQLAPPPAEPANPQLETSSKPAPRSDVPATRQSQDTPPPARTSKPAESASASRSGGAAGVYETVRPTSVFQAPTAGSPIVANIPGGTRINVVASRGEWLEVHSRRGNPPGFIRRDDATFVSKGE